MGGDTQPPCCGRRSKVDVTDRRVRVLVTGGAGNVAGWLVRTAPEEVEVHVTEHVTAVPVAVRDIATVHSVDLRDEAATAAVFHTLRPDVVIHAAYVQDCRDGIVDATRSVAACAARCGASLVHLSTDVVFSGDRPPYTETDEPDPISDYGRWKAEAERCSASAVPDVCIVRISMAVSLDPPDRVTATLLAALRSGDDVTLFDDEMRQPIRTVDLARELWSLVSVDRMRRAGVWHLPGPEHLSRMALGLRMARLAGVPTATVRSASASTHPVPRPRDPELSSVRRGTLGVTLMAVDIVAVDDA